MAAQRILKFGSKGQAVRRLQERLTRLGFDVGGIDGDFGIDTEKGVKAFQTANGLLDDGEVGPLTMAAIVAAEMGTVGRSSGSVLGVAIAAAAQGQFEEFRLDHEADDRLCRQIQRYWTDGVGAAAQSCVSVPWSAAFISWCVRQGGPAADSFTFAGAHSVFVFDAIKHAEAGAGVFRGFDFQELPVQVGDILQNNRGGATRDFAFAKANRNYESHSRIIVQVAQDDSGPFAVAIGGNEGNTVARNVVRLTPAGKVKQRHASPYISLVRIFEDD